MKIEVEDAQISPQHSQASLVAMDAQDKTGQIIDRIVSGPVEDAVVAFEHLRTECRQDPAAAPTPPGAAVTTGSVKA